MELASYLDRLQREFATGIAAEHAYRPALEALLESIEPGKLNAVNDPKRTEGGAPDFIVLRGQIMIGFVEAKDLNVGLDRVERSEQMVRYLKSYSNLLLTDYLEFRWYVQGQPRWTVRVGAVKGKKIVPDRTQYGELENLLRQFATTITPTITTANELAQRMAGNAQVIRDLIVSDLNSDSPNAGLVAQREAFARTLLPDLDTAQFADMYAQTLAYGLFAARVNYTGAAGTFSRRGASEDIPQTNPFLRRLFASFGLDLGERVTWLVDNLADLLAHADTDEILKDFGKKTRQEDPVVHFYETFLREYDPKLRDQRGVYYTPEPVVSYIVRSVDTILRERFGRADGLADPNTLVLDPATGTGTFLYFVIQHIYETMFTGQKGAWDGYVRDHLLKRIFGFELLMAPYAVAHMKLGLQLRDLGYSFSGNQRLGVYLTNTLEEASKTSETLFAQFISEEANEAAAIKRDKPIMVVLGNPPYSGISANKGNWIETLMEDYKKSVRHEERQIQGLSNDYVKFLRFAQWRIEQTGEGIVAFITDNSYLDGILFRDMRKVLLETFSDIYVFNLHGKSIRGPISNAEDVNVFDITQGVSIVIFIKKVSKSPTHSIFYSELKGKRLEKYNFLLAHDFKNTKWEKLEPRSPSWLFVPHVSDAVYEAWPLFTEIIGTGNPKTDRDKRYGTGIKTRHDHFVIGWNNIDAVTRVKQISNRRESDEELIQNLNLCKTAHFDIKRARVRAESLDLDKYLQSITYRPFDVRQVVYLREFVCEPKFETMRHLQAENIAMAVLRRDRKEKGTGYFVAQGLIAKDMVSNLDDALVWPLYLYPEKKEGELFAAVDDGSPWPVSAKGRRPNLNPAFIKDMAGRLGLTFVPEAPEKPTDDQTFTPEDVFHYAYAVFHSPTYRERYAEFLKIDFPRLPLTGDVALFRQLGALGARLVDLHLLRGAAVSTLLTTYPESGTNRVEKGYPKFDAGKVYINKTQYFDGVPETVWDFHVGGYQVLDKWLKDRRERELTYADIQHYQRVVVALAQTIMLMDEIDRAIGAWPLR